MGMRFFGNLLRQSTLAKMTKKHVLTSLKVKLTKFLDFFESIRAGFKI